MNFQTLHKQRKMILIAAAIGLIATVLPWFRVSIFGFSQSVNAWHGLGFLVVLGFVVAGAMAFLGDQTLPLTSSRWFGALAGGALALLMSIVFWIRVPADLPMGAGGVSIGLYLSIAAALGVLYFSWANRAPGATLRDGFDAAKKDLNERRTNLGNPMDRTNDV